jgi:ZIP family zinc transporter
VTAVPVAARALAALAMLGDTVVPEAFEVAHGVARLLAAAGLLAASAPTELGGG